AALSLFLAAACQRAPRELPDSKGKIPVYPRASLVKDDGPFDGFTTDGPKSMLHGRMWKLVTNDAHERVVDFYSAQLPEVKPEEVEHEDGKVTRFKWVPGAPLEEAFGEFVHVDVPREPKDGKLHILV